MKHRAIYVGIGVALGVLITFAFTVKAERVTYTAPEEEPKVVLIEAETTEDAIKEKIRKTWPEDPVVAVAIGQAESELDTNAFNPEQHKNCKGSVGVMQIACVHNPHDIEALKDLDTNLLIARRVYDEKKAKTGNGWLAWGSYTDGRYKQYMP